MYLGTTPAARRWIIGFDLRIFVLTVCVLFLGSTATAQCTSLQWSVSAPAITAVEPYERIPISISVQSSGGASDMRVWQAGLTEIANKRPLTDGVLCSRQYKSGDDAHPPCGSDGAFSGSISGKTVVWMKTLGEPGQYQGSLTLSAGGDSDVKVVTQMTVYVSTFWWKLRGIGWIALGVLIAWLTTVAVRNNINRAQMRIPAALLRASLTNLRDRLARRPDPLLKTKYTNEKIDYLLATALSDKLLEVNGLPRWLPSPWGVAAVSSLNTYQAYIAAQTDWVNDLSVMVDGIETAFQVFKPGDSKIVSAVQTCLAKIDILAQGTTAPIQATVIGQVQAALATLSAAAVGTSAEGFVAKPGTPPNPQQLDVQVNLLVFAGWLLILFATVATGAYVLIFSSNGDGFGKGSDYLLCFLWGMGLPTGASLLQGSSSSVTTAFSVSK